MDYTNFLRKNNIKVTKARISILNILFNCEDSIDADYIFRKCRKEEFNVNLSTIYRTLEVLLEKGIVNKFDLGDGKYNYKLKSFKHKHKIKCDLCKKEVEIECPMPQVEELIKNATGFSLVHHELKITGICTECKEKCGKNCNKDCKTKCKKSI